MAVGRAIALFLTLTLAMVLGLMLWPARPVSACGPIFLDTVFSHTGHPDLPMARFVRGDLGILQPTYPRAYLYVAYRHLAGRGLDPEEQKAVTAFWTPPARANASNAPQPENWIKAWVEARNKIPGAAHSPGVLYAYDPAGIYRWASGGNYYEGYYNCLADAFHTAVITLNQRTARFGAQSGESRSWVEAQDQVFGNCPGGAPKILPASAEPAAPPLVRADRAYQIAAANFYFGDLEGAKTMFEEIARDHSSPWSQVAPLLVARVLIRQATLRTDKPDPARLAQAEAQLKKVLADPRLKETHPSAERLLGYVQLRLRPMERLGKIRQALLEKLSPGTFRQDLVDYTLMLDKFIERDADSLSALRKQDEMADWMLTFQQGGPAALEHALQKWEETASLPWLVASLSKVRAGHPKLAALLAAAEKVQPGSPAFGTAAFHSLRLAIESGTPEEQAQARARLDGLLGRGPQAFPPSARNLFLALRLKLARNLDEFLKTAPRVPAAVLYESFPGEESASQRALARRARFDSDSARALTLRMPLSMLVRSAQSRRLPEHLRRELAVAAWVRSVLLDNEEAGKQIAPVLAKLAPELENDLDAYLSAPDAEGREFAAVFAILKFPGMRPYVPAGVGRETPFHRIDNFRNNWWCAMAPAQQMAPTQLQEEEYWSNWQENRLRIPAPLRILYPENQVGWPGFLSGAQRAAAQAEWTRLSRLETAPSYLARQVTAWARSHPDDPRAPQALHLAVKSTRYGCADDKTPKYSRAAFELLHSRYPNSPWAQKTKYWYR